MTRRKKMLEQLDEDFHFHIEMETQENIDRGMSPDDARYAALRKFGNVAYLKEQTHEVWMVVWLEQFLQDARYGVRMLASSPSLTIAAVLAIALGVGINVGIFSVLNGLALRLLPIPHAQEVLSVNQVLHWNGHGERFINNNAGYFSWTEYKDFRDHNHVFTGLAAYQPFVEATLAGASARSIIGAATSCNYFDVLEEAPALGRGFAADDCATSGANAVIVISDAMWRNQFGADPALIGRSIVLNRVNYTVIGVAPPKFTGTEPFPAEFWAPVTMSEALEPGSHRLTNDNMSWLGLIGRRRAEVTLEGVHADLDLIAQRINQKYPNRTIALSIHAARFLSSPEERRFLIPVSSVILTAFGFVLLIACVNVTNLLLARASVRQKEIALRLSLGAGRVRLVRQLLTESLLLSVAGGALGSVIACLSFVRLTSFVTSHLPSDVPNITINASPDFHVLAFALLLTFSTGIAFGLLPALQSTRPNLTSGMQGNGAALGGKKKGRFLLKTLVGAQVAICMVLLLAAGLLLRGLCYAQTVDPGFEIKGIASTMLNLSHQGYDQVKATQFMHSYIETLHGLPGVTEVALAECAPLAHDFSESRFTLQGSSNQVSLEYNHVTPAFFALTAIPIVRGRNFTADENHESLSVIVTESTARRLWPGQDPLGKTLRETEGRLRTVIGVARDAQVSHLGDSASNYMYYPFGPEDNSRAYVLVRYAASFKDLEKGMRTAALSIDPHLAIDVSRLEDYLEVWRAPSRIVAGLSGTLGALGLLLCSIGVYGMVSYSVSRSVREIGIRLALGADKGVVFRHLLWRSMQPVLIGGVIGIALCAAVSNLLTGMMFGIGAHDPFAFVAVPFLLLGIALIATLLPARRALDVDPAVTLRCE